MDFPVSGSQPKSMLWLPGVATPEGGLPISPLDHILYQTTHLCAAERVIGSSGWDGTPPETPACSLKVALVRHFGIG